MSEIQPHRKRIRHYDGEGCARSLTFSCLERRPLFSRDRSCQWMIDAMERGRKKHPIHIWAYVVMPEHVHVLVWPTSHDLKISRFLSTVKQSVSKRARIHLQRTAPQLIEGSQAEFHFWQDGPGYDRNLWNAKYVWETIDYIHANPVRRRLCARPEDWHWSSAKEYAGLGPGPLAIDRTSLPEDPRG